MRLTRAGTRRVACVVAAAVLFLLAFAGLVLIVIRIVPEPSP